MDQKRRAADMQSACLQKNGDKRNSSKKVEKLYKKV